MKRTCYASHSVDAGNMLAVWLDERPSCSKEQKDPDGWCRGVERTDFLAKRLAELAKAPEVEVVWQHGAAAEWWSRSESGRKRAASKARRERLKDVQTLIAIPEDIEQEGRNAAFARARR